MAERRHPSVPYPHTESRHDTDAFTSHFHQAAAQCGEKHGPWAITWPIILALSHPTVDLISSWKMKRPHQINSFLLKKNKKLFLNYQRNICLEKFQEIQIKQDTVKVKSHLLDSPLSPKSGVFKLYCAESWAPREQKMTSQKKPSRQGPKEPISPSPSQPKQVCYYGSRILGVTNFETKVPLLK